MLKRASQGLPVLIAVGGLLAGAAAAVGQAYIEAKYSAISAGALPSHLNVELPSNTLLQWIYLALVTVDLWPLVTIFAAFALLLWPPLSILYRQAKSRYPARNKRVGTIVVLILLVAFLASIAYFARQLWFTIMVTVADIGIVLLMILAIRAPGETQRTLDRSRLSIQLFMAMPATLVLISVLIIWVIPPIVQKAAGYGWENSCHWLESSPAIVFSAEHPIEIDSQLAITPTLATEPYVYQGRLLLRTDAEYLVFASTVTRTNPFTSTFEFIPWETTTIDSPGCSPSRITVVPAGAVRFAELSYDTP